MTELWAKPGEPDWGGDIMTQECLDDIMCRTTGDTNVFIGSSYNVPDDIVGTFSQVRKTNYQKLGLVLAPDVRLTQFEIIRDESGNIIGLIMQKVDEFNWCLQRDQNDPLFNKDALPEFKRQLESLEK